MQRSLQTTVDSVSGFINSNSYSGDSLHRVPFTQPLSPHLPSSTRLLAQNHFSRKYYGVENTVEPHLNFTALTVLSLQNLTKRDLNVYSVAKSKEY